MCLATPRLHPLAPVLRSALGALLLLAALSAPLPAQIALGARFGGGEGTANYSVGELNVRVGVADRLYVVGGFEMMGAAWTLEAGGVTTYHKEYDGYTVSVGAAFAVIDEPAFYVAGRGAVGIFVRTGSEFEGSRDLSGSLGVDAEVRLLGPVRLQVGLTHQRIFDGRYHDLVGERPHVTYLTAGITVVVKDRGR